MRLSILMLPLFALSLAAAPGLHAEEVTVDPLKVQQLKRVEPLSAEKLNIFVQAGALSRAQADLLAKHIDGNGRLKLPERYVGSDTRTPPARPSAPPPNRGPASAPPRDPGGHAGHGGPDGPPPLVRDSSGTYDVMGWIKRDDGRAVPGLPGEQSRNLTARVRNYRYAGEGERIDTRRLLRAAGAAANPLIAQFYNDPIDLDVKVDLWRAVARPDNPRAAGYIAYTHQQAMKVANPVLVPYAKDVGGLILRREKGAEEPLRKWYESRELRDLILDLEESISHCSGVRAAMYLMDVYAARYNTEQAPMRDDSRDRKRMVQACGGDARDFDQDEPKTWRCTLNGHERILIAERLYPHLRSHDKDTRKIAANGLMIVLNINRKIKDYFLDDARGDWQHFMTWYGKQLDELRQRP